MSEKHLTGYAKAIQEINRLMSGVVFHELKKDDLQIVIIDAPAQSRNVIDRAWKITSN